MSNSLTIKQTASLKESLKLAIGRAVSIVSQRRSADLLESPISQPSNFRDKAIMAFLKQHAMENNLDTFFERLHQDFWIGQGGAIFADNCDHRFEDLFLAKQKVDFEQLFGLWNESGLDHIVEFGCNSGLLLNYMTTQLKDVKSAIGIEINADQVLRNQQSDKFDPRIVFANEDGAEWLIENGQSRSLFVSNGGVLEYFRRKRLDEMMTHISTNLSPAVYFAVEPVADDHDWDKSTESVPFGEELSFSHNYTHLFETNGFELVHQRAVEFNEWKMMATIAVTK